MGRPRGQGSVDGFAIALERDPAKPVSLAVYLEAVRRDRLGDFERAARPCPLCRARTALLIRFNTPRVFRQVGCPKCVPSTRSCAKCGKARSLSDFDITPRGKLGFVLESYCGDCRRAKHREYYLVMHDVPRNTPAKIKCFGCGRIRPSKEFAVDGRYTTGRLGRCHKCRAEYGRQP